MSLAFDASGLASPAHSLDVAFPASHDFSYPCGSATAPSILTCAYVTDRAFLACTVFSALSLVASASAPVAIHILTVGVDPKDRTTADAYLKKHGISARFAEIPGGDMANLHDPLRLPKASYGRLFLDRLLPDVRGRVLYIDGDTLVDVDVVRLLTMPLDDAVLGAVEDVGRIVTGFQDKDRVRLQLGPSGRYFNSGVLLIDIDRWRRGRIGSLALDMLHSDCAPLVHGDQCALNYVLRGQWKPLPAIWNSQTLHLAYGDARDEACIAHFIGSKKPWVRGHSHHAAGYVRRYAEYFAESPWAAEGGVDVRWPLWREARRLASLWGTPRGWSRRSRFRTWQAQSTVHTSSAGDAPSAPVFNAVARVG